MLNLNIKLENKTSYINTFSYFPKSIIIKENLNQEKTVLVICESDENIKQYEKIFSFIWININLLKNRNDLTNFIYNNEKLFFCEANIFDNEVVDSWFLESENLSLNIGEEINMDDLIESLNSLWYKFSESYTGWSYKKLWDILTITSLNWNTQYKISFWWDKIDEISKSEVFEEAPTGFKMIDKIYLWNNISLKEDISNKSTTSFKNIINQNNKVFSILDSIDFTYIYEDLVSSLTNFCNFDYIWNKSLAISDLEISKSKIDNIDNLLLFLKDNKYKEKIIYTKNTSVITNFIEYNNLKNIKVFETKLNNLKSFNLNNKLIICDDIINGVFIRKRIKKSLSTDMDLLLKIKPLDYIVHIDHGIWIFKWIIEKELWNIKREYVEIEYKWDEKLFVPITEVARINKYVWVTNPKLTWLNTKEWERKLKKASEDIQVIANELLEIYSKRKLHSWYKFIIDSDKLSEFRSSFPYIYTEDQNRVIEEILSDMNKSTPMDRLLVWDVWFGKTEVAFNAIYNSFLNKKQSILISPLVVLAYEHFEKALDRFKEYWLNIKVLTRLETSKSVSETLVWLKKWTIDLVIWTHKLLSEDIEYKDLWLMIIDEEHKFWAVDKEKIKKYKSNIDVLSMSATPIPRSLNMALSSLRDMSIIKTPPYGRQNIKTVVSAFNENSIYDAMNREFERWWQVFFIHNRVRNIWHFEKIINSIFPEKNTIITHGQLPGQELEKRIIDFKHKKYDVLLSTTVIENGIDFSNVNTIIINDAEGFWLSTIHQLRWRVGRSDKKWYCHLFYKKQNLKKEQVDRLKTIVEYSYLWAWFELAMKDLEIRWWWDLLWIKQSGQATEIWVNLFIKMVEDRIEKLKLTHPHHSSDTSLKSNERLKEEININTKIDLNIESYLPDDFFGSELDKINFYREIECLNTIEELDNIILDFKNINSELPTPAINLFNLLLLKIKASHYKIIWIKRVWINYQIDFDSNINLEELKEFLKLDKEVMFTVTSIHRLRSETKKFWNSDEKFLNYLLKLFEKKIINKKIKLKKKAWE